MNEAKWKKVAERSAPSFVQVDFERDGAMVSGQDGCLERQPFGRVTKSPNGLAVSARCSRSVQSKWCPMWSTSTRTAKLGEFFLCAPGSQIGALQCLFYTNSSNSWAVWDPSDLVECPTSFPTMVSSGDGSLSSLLQLKMEPADLSMSCTEVLNGGQDRWLVEPTSSDAEDFRLRNSAPVHPYDDTMCMSMADDASLSMSKCEAKDERQIFTASGLRHNLRQSLNHFKKSTGKLTLLYIYILYI